MNRRASTRRIIVTVGGPAFVAGAIAAVIVFELPGVILSAVPVSDPAAGPASSPPAGEPAPQPAAAQAGPPAPARERRPETDLLAPGSRGEVSVHGRGTYVSFTDRSGLWALADPTMLARSEAGAWEEGGGMPFAGRSLAFVVHQELVRRRCVHAHLEADRPMQVAVSSGGRKRVLDVPEGRSVLETLCAGRRTAGAAMRLTLSPVHPLAPETRPRVLGLWLAGEDESPATGDAPRLEPCGGGGLRVGAGRSVTLRALAEAGDTLEVRASGGAVADLRIRARGTSSGSVDVVDADGPAAVGGELTAARELSVARQRPVEVTVALAPDAGTGVCLERLALVHRHAGPALDVHPIPRARGVIFFLTDTLRYDALGAFDPGSPVKTPRLDALARESVRFTNVVAHSNYTKPTVASLLTGRYPHATGGLPHKGALTDDVPLVSELLERQGVHTTGLFSNRFLVARFNFMRGWDVERHVNSYRACLDGDFTSEAWVEFIDSFDPPEPFFLYIHLMDPHAPYSPRSAALEVEYVGHRVLDGRFSPKSTSRFILELRRGKVDPPDKQELRTLRGLYRGDVATLDVSVGRIMDALERSGLLEQTMVVVASDHGEEFMEHGWLGHGTSIHPELTHVPLMIRLPGVAVTGEFDRLVGQVDLMPTVLEALGVEPPAGIEGRSLLELLDAPAGPGGRDAHLMQHWNGTYGLRVGHWMVIAGGRSTSLARLEGPRVWYQDPGRRPVAWLLLRERLALATLATRDGAAEPNEAHVDEQTRRQLEALGYVLD